MDKIKDLRLKINKIDEKLFELIVERMDFAKEIGEIKKVNGLGIVDKDREKEVIDQLITKANKKRINSDLVKKVWKVLMEISYEIETSSEPHKGSVGEGGKNGNG